MPITNKGLVDVRTLSSGDEEAPFPAAHAAFAAPIASEAGGRAAPTRGLFVKGALAGGVVAALAGAAPLGLSAVAPEATTCKETVQDVLNTTLTFERLAMTFYHAALTSAAIVGSTRGNAANSLQGSRIGGARSIAHLQTALDQERQHARFLMDYGAMVQHTSFYFPTMTFEGAGYTSRSGTFLWSLDHLETAFIGIYLAAVIRFGALGHGDLAVTMGRILGTECEHRALGRVIAGDDPVDNVTLEVSSFTCVGDAAKTLNPFLTGAGFKGATRRVAVPSQADVARLVGSNVSTEM
jgi:hypothetical protein